MAFLKSRGYFLWLLPMIFACSASADFAADATALVDTEAFSAARHQRFLVVELKRPHRVISTSYINGGQQSRLRYLVNHQSMESRGDAEQLMKILKMGHQAYHQQVARQLGIDAAVMALMGTAADVQQLGHASASFGDLRVDALVTAGVKGNAMRAGDPARWYQTPEGNRHIDYQGTINILVLINQPVTEGAQQKVAILATEAKSAALAELAVPSVRSRHLATGTGTDQLTVASVAQTATETGQFVRASASGHLKIGELVGTSVRQAVLQALRQQNGLQPRSGVDIFYALGRFGFDRGLLLEHWQSVLNESEYKLAEANLQAMATAPRLVASGYAFAALLDRMAYGALPSIAAREALRDLAAQAAVALSAKPDLWLSFWRQLSPQRPPAELFAQAMTLGWQAKWASSSAKERKPEFAAEG